MLKVFLVTLLLHANGYDKGQEWFIGGTKVYNSTRDTNISVLVENSEAMQACEALKRQKEITEFYIPKGYLNIAFVCEVRF